MGCDAFYYGRDRSQSYGTCARRQLACSLEWSHAKSGRRELMFLLKRIFCVLSNALFGRYAVPQLVEALRYMLEGRGFDSRRWHWNFSLA
jgi:hypothetical protein